MLNYDIAGGLEKNRPDPAQHMFTGKKYINNNIVNISANITEIMQDIHVQCPKRKRQTSSRRLTCRQIIHLHAETALPFLDLHSYGSDFTIVSPQSDMHGKKRWGGSCKAQTCRTERSLGNSSQHLLRLSCLICNSSQQTVPQTCTSRLTRHFL